MTGSKIQQELLDDEWINDHTYSTYKTNENGVSHKSLGHTTAYTAWYNMKKRCTNKQYRDEHQTYIGVSASSEFKDFTKFHDWWHKQVGHDMSDIQLDKDLLIKGNKIYSQETCLLVPKFVNNFLIKSDVARGDCVIGVHKQGAYRNGDTRYKVQIMDYDVTTRTTEQKFLGYFRNELDAFHVYKSAKEVIAKKHAAYLMGKVDDRVITALLNFNVEIDD